jgi:protein SCO1
MNKPFLGFALLLAAACHRAPVPTPEPVPTTAPEPAVAAPELPAVDAPSVYELDVTLTDQDGQRRTLESLRGQPVILTMFYGRCPYACPTLISDIKRALKLADPVARSAYDPERDTPEVLKGLAAIHHVDLEEWRFTSADDGKERELSAVLGIKYKRLASTHIQHTSVIAVLDAEGKLRHRREGTQEGSDEALVRALNAVAAGAQPSG